VFADPQALARGLTVSLPHSAGSALDLVASPLRLAKTPPEYQSAPPLLGEHTDAVLREALDLTADDVTRLRAASVIA
jgi:crotonobetainyl-CoA:carnitine CoA-transferase CaiB-like acyl-CoA transferase